jgi:hypothetical protein
MLRYQKSGRPPDAAGPRCAGDQSQLRCCATHAVATTAEIVRPCDQLDLDSGEQINLQQLVEKLIVSALDAGVTEPLRWLWRRPTPVSANGRLAVDDDLANRQMPTKARPDRHSATTKTEKPQGKQPHQTCRVFA